MSTLLISCAEKPAEDAANESPQQKAVDVANMDQAVKPGDDFNQYANGGWIKNNPVPDDKTQFGSFSVLYDNNQIKLQELVLEAAKADAEEGSMAQKIGDLYNSGMDTLAIDKLGVSPILAELKAIDALKSNAELLPFIAKLQTKGSNPLFYFFGSQDDKNSAMVIANFYQGGLGLPDRDYYLSDDPRSTEMRTAYVAHIQRMFELAACDGAATKAKVIMALETRLAKASFTRLENRDPFTTYNKMSVSDLQELAPEVNWKEYFTVIGLPELAEINVRQKPFIQEAAIMLHELDLEDWKSYLKWDIINSASRYLSSDFAQANFEFYGTMLSGQKVQRARWKRVLGVTSGSMGEAIGKLYVEKFFPPEAKERMLKLVGNLRMSLGNRIDELDWMTAETKVLAHQKLDAINVKVGYPDKWTDYTNLKIVKGSYYQNITNARIFSFNEELAKIGKAHDKAEWGMTPQTVNAYYSPNANEIVFPAAILQPPFFFMDQDDAVNYGAIGVVIGHEMTHGFDDQGRNYDKDGNLNNWWKDEDAEAFDAKAQFIIDQFNAYPELDTLFVDGQLTLGENIADFGGLNISWDAFQETAQAKTTDKIDGFTPQQRFFLSYAGVWRQNILDKELARRLKEDVHSPGDARINVPLYNMDVFYQAFGIDQTAKLYIAPEKRAVIW
ncbi:MAG: M13 family metallopeptidase [Bacteroidales bacterium]|nr:M13 family metallopeptidase [Bacteroidales bacterium]